MTIVRRNSPFGELMSLRSAMDRLFEDSFVRPQLWTGGPDGGGSVPMDVSTTADELVIHASMPGWRPEDVEIAVEGRTLTISGQTRQEREDTAGDHGDGQGSGHGYLVREIRRDSFSRSLTLPESLEPDKATAAFENGILTLRIPKAEQAKPRQIRISPVTNGTGTSSPAGGPEASERAVAEQPAGAKA
jgi:HSP20 family protein